MLVTNCIPLPSFLSFPVCTFCHVTLSSFLQRQSIPPPPSLWLGFATGLGSTHENGVEVGLSQSLALLWYRVFLLSPSPTSAIIIEHSLADHGSKDREY